MAAAGCAGGDGRSSNYAVVNVLVYHLPGHSGNLAKNMP